MSEKEQKITHTAECKQGIPTQIIIEFPQSSVGKTVQFRDTDKVQPPKRQQETEEMHFYVAWHTSCVLPRNVSSNQYKAHGQHTCAFLAQTSLEEPQQHTKTLLVPHAPSTNNTFSPLTFLSATVAQDEASAD